MNSQLFIPTKLKVGYNERDDTYSKKLAYVIYYDQKNVLRKEKSFNSWIEEELGTDEIENVPTSGFVLNKKAGGTNYGWDARQTYTRVYDPRGFEFEITIPNLLFILQECDCSKGKGLEGEFVYSWDGADLVLLPVQSNEYLQCVEYTNIQSEKIKAKDLKIGYVYLDNKLNKLVYLGKFDYTIRSYSSYFESSKFDKNYIFYNLETDDNDFNSYGLKTYVNLKNLNNIKKLDSDSEVDNYSDLVQEYLDSPYCSEFSHYEYKLTNNDLTKCYGYDYFYMNESKYRCKLNSDGAVEYLFDKEGWCNNSVLKTVITLTEFQNMFCDRYNVYNNGSKIKSN